MSAVVTPLKLVSPIRVVEPLEIVSPLNHLDDPVKLACEEAQKLGIPINLGAEKVVDNILGHRLEGVVPPESESYIRVCRGLFARATTEQQKHGVVPQLWQAADFDNARAYFNSISSGGRLYLTGDRDAAYSPLFENCGAVYININYPLIQGSSFYFDLDHEVGHTSDMFLMESRMASNVIRKLECEQDVSIQKELVEAIQLYLAAINKYCDPSMQGEYHRLIGRFFRGAKSHQELIVLNHMLAEALRYGEEVADPLAIVSMDQDIEQFGWNENSAILLSANNRLSDSEGCYVNVLISLLVAKMMEMPGNSDGDYWTELPASLQCRFYDAADADMVAFFRIAIQASTRMREEQNVDVSAISEDFVGRTGIEPVTR